jgi:diadenosine tetraphosphate (Ap4A) HIT family hydrolase
MTDIIGCLACDLTAGRRQPPGGSILRTPHWAVEHCVGPLGVGTLIVKPLRHVVHIWELTEGEAAELGPLLRRVSSTIAALLGPDQVYVCLWSHADWTASHIHFVLQPVWSRQRDEHPRQGPFLQAEMFDGNITPPVEEMAALAARAREHLGQAPAPLPSDAWLGA